MNQEQDKVTGIVDRIIFSNKDNGYHILSVKLPNKDDSVVINVYHPTVHEGITYEFEGQWTVHPTYGKQMKAKTIYEVAPNTKEGLRAYLSSTFFPGIGPIISGRIINHFKDDVIKIFNEDIDKLLLVPGISPKKLKVIKESWEENNEINSIMMFLQKYGISTIYAARIYEYYGKGCVSQIKENPYSLAKDIQGIGFKYADNIALEMGVDKDSQERIRACALHVLESGSLEGHCYLTDIQIIKKSTEILAIDVGEKMPNILKYMIQDSEIILYEINEEKRYYSKKLYYNEKYCANKIGELLLRNKDIEIPEGLIKDGNLSDEQKNAVLGVISKGVSILSGSAGCGKTYTSKVIVDIFLKLNKNILLAAPTGRASKVLTQSTGLQATTIHRLLGWDPENFGFMHHEKNPIDADVILIDESSMIDINLASSVLKATPNNCKIIFVGDFNQIPPIGPGAFFKDLIESGVVPTFMLTQIFRQSKESQIIKYAHQIKNGETPKIKSPLIEPDMWKNGTDCMFIDSGLKEYGKSKNEYPKWSSLRYGMDVIEMVRNLYISTIKKYHDINDIQILIPFKISKLGTIRMNEIIQQEVNPPSKNKNEIKIKNTIFREGDKILHNINNPELEIFNGEIGWIKHINKEDETADIEFEGGRIVKYKKFNMTEIEHSYAISCHKSQGSGFKCVILPIVTQYSRLLSRNLLYTSITRGISLVVFVGQRKALDMAVNNVNPLIRQTSLKELLIETDAVNSMII